MKRIDLIVGARRPAFYLGAGCRLSLRGGVADVAIQKALDRHGLRPRDDGGGALGLRDDGGLASRRLRWAIALPVKA